MESDRQIDMTIRIRPGEFKRNNSWYVCDEIVFPVCSPRYLGNAEPIESIDDLHKHPLIHSSDPCRGRIG